MSESMEGRVALLVWATMFVSVLSAGVTLVLFGGQTPTEASLFVAPFLMAVQHFNRGPALPPAVKQRADRR
ncbi:hypothetical protein AB0O22_38920 [Streptomyces sp. NPDC091204]|uniref:hypothetical protein n=1 Tax=Streptomyces sp. NPDC091204 TaxID=3155299 RepID=UPI003443F5F6